MNIKVLSDLTHVNVETIRAYRKKGLLHPRQNPDNHYYEYSEEDFLTLLHIKKLRSSNLSLDSIAMTFRESDTDRVIDEYRKQLTVMQEELQQLQVRITGLQITLRHLDEYQGDFTDPREFEAFDEKVDCYYDDCLWDSTFDIWIRNAGMFTQSIGISREVLLAPELPDRVPIKMGLGTYRLFLTQNNIPVPKKNTACPKGTYVSIPVILTDLRSIEKEQLMPLLSYIREHHYRIDSDVTAFMFRIDYSGDQPKYLFRLRVKIAEEKEYADN